METSYEHQNLCGMNKVHFNLPVLGSLSDNFMLLEILMKLIKSPISPQGFCGAFCSFSLKKPQTLRNN